MDTVLIEEQVGRLQKNRRNEVFLVTKTHERNGEETKKIISRLSIKRMEAWMFLKKT